MFPISKSVDYYCPIIVQWDHAAPFELIFNQRKEIIVSCGIFGSEFSLKWKLPLVSIITLPAIVSVFFKKKSFPFFLDSPPLNAINLVMSVVSLGCNNSIHSFRKVTYIFQCFLLGTFTNHGAAGEWEALFVKLLNGEIGKLLSTTSVRHKGSN